MKSAIMSTFLASNFLFAHTDLCTAVIHSKKLPLKTHKKIKNNFAYFLKYFLFVLFYSNNALAILCTLLLTYQFKNSLFFFNFFVFFPLHNIFFCFFSQQKKWNSVKVISFPEF